MVIFENINADVWWAIDLLMVDDHFELQTDYKFCTDLWILCMYFTW